MLTAMEEAEPLERQQLELEQQQQEQDLEPQELEDLEQQELELEELEQQEQYLEELEQEEQELEELEQQELEELEQQEQELEELEQQEQLELEELEQQEQELEELEQHEQELEELELEQQEQELEELEQQQLELEELEQQEQELEELEQQEQELEELEQQEIEELNQQEQRLEHQQKEPEQQKPQQQEPICKQCSATYSAHHIWWRWINPDNPYEPWKVGTVICNDCWAANDEKKRQARKNLTTQVEVKEKPKVVIRKSARIRNMTSTRSSSAAVRKQINYKAPDPVLVPIDSEYVICNNTRFRRGDIVSLKLQGQTVYAQLRGFLKDQYSNKSTVITWLMPTARSRPADEGFEPSTYQIGFEEDSPRPLTDFRFEMHAPNKFYLLVDNAHPPSIGDPFQTGYIPDPTL